MNPYQVVRDFESALCDYTGAKYAVTTTSCTAALMLAVARHMWGEGGYESAPPATLAIEIPRYTYVSVPMAILHGGALVQFRNEDWVGEYRLDPFDIWDCARWFRRGMYRPGTMQCLSFHWTKHLAIGQGGCIRHDNDEADEWLRRARFDGRKEGVAPKDDTFTMIGSHCYMSPRDAAEGLSRLAVLPENLQPLPNSEYPDLSQLEIFQ